MRLIAVAACGLAGALGVAGPAGAHIGVTPGFLTADDTQTLSLSVHNDLGRPMTGLVVMAPNGLRIVAAGAVGDWQRLVKNGTATWTGGPLAPNTGGTFALDVEVGAATPGPVQLQANQLYPGGGSLTWPISVTVIPAGEESQRLTWAIVGAVALLMTVGIATIALRRRGRSLQER